MQRKQIAAVPQEVLLANQSAPDVRAEDVALSASSFSIRSEADYRQGAEMLKQIAAKQKLWLGGDRSWKGWNALVSAAKVVYDMLRDARDAVSDQLEKSRASYEKEMSEWLLREEAKNQKRQADAAAEILSIEKRATELRRDGDSTEADYLDIECQMLAMGANAPARPIVEGVAVESSFTVEITDLRAFLEDVLAGALPMEGVVMGHNCQLIEVRESLIKEFRKSMGSNFHVRGVKITEKKAFRVAKK